MHTCIHAYIRTPTHHFQKSHSKLIFPQVKRVGPTHQAGSDSLVTSLAFFKMARMYFENNIDEAKYAGVLYGLGQYSS